MLMLKHVLRTKMLFINNKDNRFMYIWARREVENCATYWECYCTRHRWHSCTQVKNMKVKVCTHTNIHTYFSANKPVVNMPYSGWHLFDASNKCRFSRYRTINGWVGLFKASVITIAAKYVDFNISSNLEFPKYSTQNPMEFIY